MSRTIDADLTTHGVIRRSGTSVSSMSTADTINFDFQKRREFGGMVISWEPGRRASSYEIQGSKDGQGWQTLYTVNRTSVSPYAQTLASNTKTTPTTSPLFRDYLYMPETDAVCASRVKSAENRNGYGIRDIAPPDWAGRQTICSSSSPGMQRGSPRYLSNEQSYWTVLGVDRDRGAVERRRDIEVGRGQFRSSHSSTPTASS